MTVSEFRAGDRVRLSQNGLARRAASNPNSQAAPLTGTIARTPSLLNHWARLLPVLRDGSKRARLFPASFWEMDPSFPQRPK